jgi:thymidylate kinase
MMLHPKLEALFREFNQEELTWCILRLPHGLAKSDGDVDLLVDSAHLLKAGEVMPNQGFVRVPIRSTGVHYLTFDPASGQWIWLHLVSELSFGPLALLKTRAESGCLARRKRNGSIFSLSPDDSFWVLLFHCLLDKGEIRPYHQIQLQELASSAISNGALGTLWNELSPVGWPSELVLDLVCKDEWAKLARLAQILETCWMRKQGISITKRLLTQLNWKVDKVRKTFINRGLGVAVLGPDGAGKSTLVGEIQEKFIFPAHPVYMGLTGGLLRYVDKLRLPFLIVPGRIFIFWCRYLYAIYHQLRGRLVVFDRYVLDYAVPTPYPLNSLQKGIRWIDGHSIPLPDMVFVLDAPGELMFQRKGEYDPKMLEEWRRRFLALEGQISNLEILDTTGSIDDVIVDAIDRIWKRYAFRWNKYLKPSNRWN